MGSSATRNAAPEKAPAVRKPRAKTLKIQLDNRPAMQVARRIAAQAIDRATVVPAEGDTPAVLKFTSVEADRVHKAAISVAVEAKAVQTNHGKAISRAADRLRDMVAAAVAKLPPSGLVDPGM